MQGVVRPPARRRPAKRPQTETRERLASGDLRNLLARYARGSEDDEAYVRNLRSQADDALFFQLLPPRLAGLRESLVQRCVAVPPDIAIEQGGDRDATEEEMRAVAAALAGELPADVDPVQGALAHSLADALKDFGVDMSAGRVLSVCEDEATRRADVLFHAFAARDKRYRDDSTEQALRQPPGSAIEDQGRAPAGSTGLPEAHESGANAWEIISRGGLPVPDGDPMSRLEIARTTYPHESFEAALLNAFPGREDIQDLARHHFYDDFDPRVDSYENISVEVLEEVGSFLETQQGSTDQRR